MPVQPSRVERRAGGGTFLSIRFNAIDFQIALLRQLKRQPPLLAAGHQAEAAADSSLLKNVFRGGGVCFRQTVLLVGQSIWRGWVFGDRNIGRRVVGVAVGVDFAGRGADQQRAVGNRQAADVAIDVGLPNLAAVVAGIPRHLAAAAGEDRIATRRQSAVSLVCRGPFDTDLRQTLTLLLNRWAKISRHLAELEEQVLPLDAGLVVFRAIDLDDRLAGGDVGLVAGERHLAAVDPGGADVAVLLVHGQEVMRP